MSPRVVSLSPEAMNWARLCGIDRVEFSPAEVLVTFFDGGSATLSAARLFDDAPARFDSETGQRLTPAVSASPAELSEAQALGAEIVLTFANGEKLELPLSALAALASPPRKAPRAAPWRSEASPRRFNAEDFLDLDEVRRRALAAVARDGVCLLFGAQPRAGVLEAIVGAFGHVRETNYGRLFEVRASPAPNNLAYTTRALAPHTDNPYREPPPGLQLLHCIEASNEGGETILVDGLAGAEALRASSPTDFEVLSRTPVRFCWRDAEIALEARAPVIELDCAGDVIGVRVNDRALAPLDVDADRIATWRDAYRRFCAHMEDPGRRLRLRLVPGDVLILDNRRVLHGRGAYEGARLLQGCYADRDALLGRLEALERAEAERRAHEALAPLAGPRGGLSYGEGVTLHAHAEQSAMLASNARQAPHLVAAALLHDLGWALDEGPHEAVGAAMAARLFGEAVAAPIRLHVDAKRYLVATEPGYAERLSPASIATLRAQGGAMTRSEAEAFKKSPGSGDAVALRRLDDCAKDPSAVGLPLAAYHGLLTDLALAHLRDDDA